MNDGVRCMLMRGGSSKGGYFVESDLPDDPIVRDRLLQRIMGSPDERQIDGIGGAHPLTSKVAIVAPAADDRADIDYLFLQIGVDDDVVSDRQNCGNLLAGVGPFALERGLLAAAGDGRFTVRIRMRNTGSVATARFAVEDGAPVYRGATSISGVPGAAGPIQLDFEDLAGGTAGALLPTGNVVDTIESIPCTLIDNGMPVVVLAADAVGISGYESCHELEQKAGLRKTLEAIRLEAGTLMGLGDVTATTIPKLTMVAPPRHGGHLSTRTFIPHRCHEAIGVLGAVSVATAALLDGSPANEIVVPPDGELVRLEHPTGFFDAIVEVRGGTGGRVEVRRAGIVRTARKLMDGTVFPRTDEQIGVTT
ncbi:MAG: 4-oxalomesaconate tautomerase [Acidimicrobiales bacterium]